MSENEQAPQPGWYPDPADASRLRWWDGAVWTEHTANQPTDAPRSAHVPPVTVAEPSPIVQPERTGRQALEAIVFSAVFIAIAAVAAFALLTTG